MVTRLEMGNQRVPRSGEGNGPMEDRERPVVKVAYPVERDALKAEQPRRKGCVRTPPQKTGTHEHHPAPVPGRGFGREHETSA